MSPRSFLAIAGVALALALALGACATSNGCEDALKQTADVTHDICKNDAAFAATPFCSICVKANHLSTTGPTDCRCTLLAYDQDVCSIPSREDAKASVRGAIKWANDSCKTFTFDRPDGNGGAGGDDGK